MHDPLLGCELVTHGLEMLVIGIIQGFYSALKNIKIDQFCG